MKGAARRKHVENATQNCANKGQSAVFLWQELVHTINLFTTLSSKVESLSESINIKDKEISALKYKIDALEKKTMESKEPDLDETLNENDWKEGVDKVHRLEGTVGKLQDLAEKNEQTTNYNTIGISDTEKVVNTLIDVVNEQDQTILMMEKKAKEKEDKINQINEKINVLTKVAGMNLPSCYKFLIHTLGITEDQIPTQFNNYNFNL